MITLTVPGRGEGQGGVIGVSLFEIKKGPTAGIADVCWPDKSDNSAIALMCLK